MFRPGAVDHSLVSHGEDLDRISLESPGENWVGAHGSPRLYELAVHHVHPPNPERDQESASRELADGRAVCKSQWCCLTIVGFFADMTLRNIRSPGMGACGWGVLANPGQSTVDNPLHLPRHPCSSVAEPIHVSHPYLGRFFSSLFSVVQLDLPRRLACLLRPSDGRRLGRPQVMD